MGKKMSSNNEETEEPFFKQRTSLKILETLISMYRMYITLQSVSTELFEKSFTTLFDPGFEIG